jgi:hypothetical protein
MTSITIGRRVRQFFTKHNLLDADRDNLYVYHVDPFGRYISPHDIGTMYPDLMSIGSQVYSQECCMIGF